MKSHCQFCLYDHLRVIPSGGELVLLNASIFSIEFSSSRGNGDDSILNVDINLPTERGASSQLLICVLIFFVDRDTFCL